MKADKRSIRIIIVISAFLVPLLFAENTSKTREPIVAGTFYPARPKKLREEVRNLLDQSIKKYHRRDIDKGPCGLIVPHAGYRFSGRTAAGAFSLLERHRKPSRILLIGPSHHFHMDGLISVAPYSHHKTPLGKLRVDEKARNALLKSKMVVSRATVHAREHSLEVELPFIQVLWNNPPPILPIIVGTLKEKEIKSLAKLFNKVIDDKTLIVASSDFTHYGKRFGFAPYENSSGKDLAKKIEALDRGAIQYIEKLDSAGFLQYCHKTGATICGRMAIALQLAILRKQNRNIKHLSLEYASSAAVLGNRSNSVSYYAHAFIPVEDKTK
ncbi:MAG: AmmeMemoRadiSam system protein B [Planctomycetes bacterium]|nr:AmmeMemoRadiSam system protein B [Planctomycetota bacterium]